MLLKRRERMMIQIDDWMRSCRCLKLLACILTRTVRPCTAIAAVVVVGIALIPSRPRTGAVDVVQLPHVLLQIKVSAESLRTNLALKRFLVIVRVHVERQIVDLMERLVADLTLVRLLAAVCQLVVLVIALLMKAFAAELAHVGLVAVVDARMGIEGG